MNTVPLVGEPLALDLVNTWVQAPGGRTWVQAPGGREFDLLETQDALRRWLVQENDRLTPRGGDVNLEAVSTLRGHIARAVEHARHGTAPPASALHAVTEAQRAAPAHRELSWDGAAVTARPRRSGDPTVTCWPNWPRPPPTCWPIHRSEVSACVRARSVGCCSYPPTPAAAGAHQRCAETACASPATTSATRTKETSGRTASATVPARSPSARRRCRAGTRPGTSGSPGRPQAAQRLAQLGEARRLRWRPARPRRPSHSRPTRPRPARAGAPVGPA